MPTKELLKELTKMLEFLDYLNRCKENDINTVDGIIEITKETMIEIACELNINITI